MLWRCFCTRYGQLGYSAGGISQEVQDCAADYLCFVSDLRDAEIAVTDAAMAAAISRRFAPPALMLHVTRKLLHREKALAPLTIEHRS